MAGSRVGYLHQLLAGSVWASIFALPLIREQTLVIAGFDDPVVPLANATIMHQLLPHSTLHPHAGGHVDLTANAAELVPVLVSTAALASSRPSAARERVSRRSRARACPPRATGPAAGCAPRRRRPESAHQSRRSAVPPCPADPSRSDRPHSPAPPWCPPVSGGCATSSPLPPWPTAPRSVRRPRRCRTR